MNPRFLSLQAHDRWVQDVGCNYDPSCRFLSLQAHDRWVQAFASFGSFGSNFMELLGLVEIYEDDEQLKV